MSPFLWGPSWFKKEEKKKTQKTKTKIPSVTVNLHFGRAKPTFLELGGLELTFPISFAIQRLSGPRGGLNTSPGGNVDRGNNLSLDESFYSAGGQPWGASLPAPAGTHALPEVDWKIHISPLKVLTHVDRSFHQMYTDIFILKNSAKAQHLYK